MRFVTLLAVVSLARGTLMKPEVDTAFCEDVETRTSDECTKVRKLKMTIDIVADVLWSHCAERGLSSLEEVSKLSPLEGLILETAISDFAEDISSEVSERFRRECGRHSKSFITAVVRRMISNTAKEIEEIISEKAKSDVTELDAEVATILKDIKSVSTLEGIAGETVKSYHEKFDAVKNLMLAYGESESRILFLDPMLDLSDLVERLAECEDEEIEEFEDEIFDLLDRLEQDGFPPSAIGTFCQPAIARVQSLQEEAETRLREIRGKADILNTRLQNAKQRLDRALDRNRRELQRTGINLAIQRPPM